ncbi:Thiolase, N-terminal domain-domain-containing protein [Protomyces lactucae-debilis]|uniref:Thiolase, N-terminal domain-domain-containing protein n=1 Tax=Protomyces lactucae-debilis TaxID=2754530 RepID=A0A1Y2FD75_PROLT|nr:Thiolase, N-terminal domain-containing protein [Protomyces lactucae-debilis]ORY81869.1 Thiolase, N-terminal domain-domain-containing protein [Protomyces lactucae-debilis]
MTNRLRQIASHITGSADDVVIIKAVRTPLCKGFKGPFKDTPVDLLVLAILREFAQNSGIDPAVVDDICVGNVSGGSNVAYSARGAALAAGFPSSTSLHTLNRWCSSGLVATQSIANAIRSGEIEVGLALGAESMSAAPRADPVLSEEILANAQAKDCTMPMGWTSENVASRYNISRLDQDAFAASSFQKAEAAQKAGRFEAEIIPVTVQVKDPKTGEAKMVTVTQDDGIRYGTTKESLAKLKPAFGKFAGPSGGASTGGNSSQITDGCAGVLMMKRSKALELNLPILARFVCATAIGCDPEVMGIGPALAIPKALKLAGLTVADVDLFEVNEAFASQALYSCRVLGLPMDKVNVNGGAIALGHPLGCTGARQIATGVSELRRSGKKVLVTSMCVGTGMGVASVIIAD